MLASIPSELLRALRLTLVVAVVTGLVYPLVVTGISQVAFHDQANGSLVTRNGQTVGSRLIGQQFTKPEYFHGRVSATVDPNNPSKASPYNAENSAGSNYGPSNQALIDRVKKDAQSTRQENGLPSENVTPRRSLKVICLPSFETFQDSASSGSRSCVLRLARTSTPPVR